MAVLLVILAAASGCVIAARITLLIVTVRGGSMHPTFHHGDRVLVARRGPRALAKDVVVLVRLPEALNPTGSRNGPSLVLKRVVALPGDTAPGGVPVPPGHVFVVGDAEDSYDSRHFGPLQSDLVQGVVLTRLRKAPQPATRILRDRRMS
ncbi:MULTISPECIES: S26 family signal peptidase [Actinomadura]|uniref:S26 family signal peptidase n=1 Tax=Actinomadura TaxID=1988 RepID=UPI0003ACE2E4|nr:S26 family signal peptidase [Actinomadura madurae]